MIICFDYACKDNLFLRHSTLRVVGCGGFRSLPPIASLHWGLFIFSPSDFGGYTSLSSYSIVMQRVKTQTLYYDIIDFVSSIKNVSKNLHIM